MLDAPLRKRISFVLLPALLFLALITGALNMLERRGVIDTIRQDDRVAYLEPGFLERTQTPRGDYYYLLPPTALRHFPVEKRPDTYRIAIVGGSFAMGEPYDAYSTSPFFTGQGSSRPRDPDGAPGQEAPREPPDRIELEGPLIGIEGWQEVMTFGGIPNWMKAILEMRFPSRRFEVINAGSPGASSSRVREAVRELARVNPDLIIVATGNNEGYVPATPFNELLHKWIVYRALKKTLLPEPALEEREYFQAQDEDSRIIKQQFRKNVEQMVAIAEEYGVPIAFATLPINLRQRDYNLSSPVNQKDEWIIKGEELAAEKRYEEALEHFARSSHQAHAIRLMARCFEKMGDFARARQFYKIYTEQYPLGRTRPSYNAFVRDICARKKLLLFDLEKVVEALSPHGIPDGQYFWDHCHLTWKGYYLMAVEIVRSLIDVDFFNGVREEPLPSPSADAIIERYGWQDLYRRNPSEWQKSAQ